MMHVSHQEASQLLHNKFIVVFGDSIQRSVYKDLVLLLQQEKYISAQQLKTKGEMSFENDCLVEGGCLSQMHNGRNYREVRQFQSDHHLVRFYFVTRIYSHYMQSILEDFQHGMKPDVVIVNSCVWDISRYSSRWISDYKENLEKFFGKLRDIMPEETLIIWNLTMPLGERIRGGFLVQEVPAQLRYDVVEANFYSGTLADEYGMDVLDLHFQFRFSLQHRTKDGVHWNALAHRRITTLLLQHIAEAWGVILPSTLTSDGEEVCSHTQKGQRTLSYHKLGLVMVYLCTQFKIFIIPTFLSSSAGRGSHPVWSESSPLVHQHLWWRCPTSSPKGSGGHWPHSTPHPGKDKDTNYICSFIIYFHFDRFFCMTFLQCVTLILRDFFSSLMTVSLSSSLTPRPSASVISALTVDALTSTGEVYRQEWTNM
uniref:Family with sequence similarity 113 n=1 Tax=Amphiprion percula TaxID=161767 RepID=A0A3P8TY55_AMPPE